MLIRNNLGTKTLLVLDNDKATSDADDFNNSINDARATLKREKACPSIRSGNIFFLEQWLKAAENPDKPPVNPPVPIPSSVTPPDKTSIRLQGEPYEEDSFLKRNQESETFSVGPPKKSLEQILRECQQKSDALKQGK